MKALIRCPHCTQMDAVETLENWRADETLFTVCAKCSMPFMVRKETRGLTVFANLQLPKPSRIKLKKAID